MNRRLLKELCLLHGVTGDTSEIEQFIIKHLKSQNIKTTQLGLGTVLVGNQKNPEKLICAHIDEVGFQITKIEDDGKIRILPVGWVFANRLDHSIVYINALGKKIRGSVFHQELLKTEHLINFSPLFVDIGANSKKDALLMGIREGQTGSFQKEYWENNGTIIATALDNRVSVFALLEIIKKNPEILKNNLIAFTNDEEMFDHSANGLSSKFSPDLAVVLDYAPIHQKQGECDIAGGTDKGPLIPYRGGNYIISEKVRKFLDNKIKTSFQKVFYSTDTLPQLEPANFQNNGETNAVNICVPAYGYHGAAYAIRKSDLENYAKLIKEVLKINF